MTANIASGNSNTPLPPGTPLPDPTPEELLRTEQLRFLYANLPVAIISNVLLALVFAAIEHSAITLARLLGWLALFGIVLLGRTGLLIIWKRIGATARGDTLRWLWRFRIGTMATGIAWGIGSILHMPSVDIVHHVYVSFILAGLTAGAITYLSIDRISAISFLLPALSPHIILLATQGNTMSVSMSVAITVFLLFLIANARLSGTLLYDNVRLRINASENESRLRQMLESSPVATRVVDIASDRVVFANASYLNMMNSSPEKVIGIVPARYYAHPEEYTQMLETLGKGARITNKLIELHSPENTWTKWVLASYSRIEYQNRPAILGWFYDITDRKLMEEQVQHLAHHDTLTGLPNRVLFDDHLQQALSIAKRDETPLALMFIDLDQFKPVNDQYGHDVGDLLLQAVAERIRGCLRQSDSVARIGGDEFVVLLPSIRAEQVALRIAEKIWHALNQPFKIAALTLNISSSTGIAFYPTHGHTEQALIKCADTAMYHVKSHGRNNVTIYRPEMVEEHT